MNDAHQINAPRQDRSRQSQTRIIDAASALMAEKSFDDITVTDICARARLSTGAFYSRFTSKTAVLYAIQKRYLSELEAGIREAADAAVSARSSLEDMACAVLLVITRPALASRGVMHAVTSESTRDVQVMRAIGGFSMTLADVLFLSVTKLLEPSGRTVLRADVAFAARACVATMQQEWLYPERPADLQMDAETLARALARLFARFVEAA